MIFVAIASPTGSRGCRARRAGLGLRRDLALVGVELADLSVVARAGSRSARRRREFPLGVHARLGVELDLEELSASGTRHLLLTPLYSSPPRGSGDRRARSPRFRGGRSRRARLCVPVFWIAERVPDRVLDHRERLVHGATTLFDCLVDLLREPVLALEAVLEPGQSPFRFLGLDPLMAGVTVSRSISRTRS